MNTYSLPPKSTTIHDIAEKLGRTRSTIARWVYVNKIPFTQIKQGDKIVATVISLDDVPKLAEIHKKRKRIEAQLAAREPKAPARKAS